MKTTFISQEKEKQTKILHCSLIYFFYLFIFFPDDFNKLCPHGTGLLPLMVSSLENHRAFIGMLAVVDLLLTFVFVRSELSL